MEKRKGRSWMGDIIGLAIFKLLLPLVAVPLGLLWGLYLLFIVVMTIRELWKG